MGYDTQNALSICNNSINYTLNDAIITDYQNNNSIIKENRISNTGYIEGMGGSFNNSYEGIVVSGDDNIIMSNELDSCGYTAIEFQGNSNKIVNNLIRNFCFIKDDGGGIYTYTGTTEEKFYDRLIKGNILLNGIGAVEGALDKGGSAEGIYLDDNTTNVNMSDNTVAYCRDGGIFLHNASKIQIFGNLLYDNGDQLFLQHDSLGNNITSIISRNNVFFSRSDKQFNLKYSTNSTSEVYGFGSLDSNYYWSPAAATPLEIITNNWNTYNHYSLLQWEGIYRKDLNSRNFNFNLVDTGRIEFFFNSGTVAKDIKPAGSFMSVDGSIHSEDLLLKPHRSAVLLKISDTSSQKDCLDAGRDTILDPGVDFTTLHGRGFCSMIDSRYEWSQISGPSSAVIRFPDSLLTVVYFSKPGNYIFDLTGCDELGRCMTDEVAIKVDTNEQDQTALLYPNPTATLVNIRLNNDQVGDLFLTIYDQFGSIKIKKRFVKNRRFFSGCLNISSLSNAVYFVSVKIGTYKVARKLIKL